MIMYMLDRAVGKRVTSDILPCAGAVCSEQASHPVAAVAVNALYTALADPEQCKHLLLHTHTVVGGSPRCDTKGGFDAAMRGLKGQLTSRLTLGACLARMCTEVGSDCTHCTDGIYCTYCNACTVLLHCLPG